MTKKLEKVAISALLLTSVLLINLTEPYEIKFCQPTQKKIKKNNKMSSKDIMHI